MAAARKKQKTANEDALEEVSKEYHPLFADPTADLVFESNDGILFRVKSWRMKVFSVFIEDLLSVPSNSEISTMEPIETGETAESTLLFLKLMDVNFPEDEFDSLDTLLGVLTLSRKFDCDMVITLFQAYLRRSTDIDGWFVFVVASQLNDVSLARHAILSNPYSSLRWYRNGYLRGCSFYDNQDEGWEDDWEEGVQNLEMSYRQGYLDWIYRWSGENHSDPGGAREWNDLCFDFVPDEPVARGDTPETD